MTMRTGRVFAAVFLIGGLAGTAALGQETQPGDKQAAAYREITALCQADTQRFCPPADQSPASPHDQMICLKTYRADLSMGCRQAVKAVIAVTHPAP